MLVTHPAPLSGQFPALSGPVAALGRLALGAARGRGRGAACRRGNFTPSFPGGACLSLGTAC